MRGPLREKAGIVRRPSPDLSSTQRKRKETSACSKTSLDRAANSLDGPLQALEHGRSPHSSLHSMDFSVDLCLQIESSLQSLVRKPPRTATEAPSRSRGWSRPLTKPRIHVISLTANGVPIYIPVPEPASREVVSRFAVQRSFLRHSCSLASGSEDGRARDHYTPLLRHESHRLADQGDSRHLLSSLVLTMTVDLAGNAAQAQTGR